MHCAQKLYIGLTFFLCCSSLSLLMLSFLSVNWVEGQFRFEQSRRNDIVIYGLFKGTYFTFTNIGVIARIHDLHQTCLPQEKVCAYSCKNTLELRRHEVLSLYNKKPIDPSCGGADEFIDVQLPDDIPWFSEGVYKSTVVLMGISMATTILAAFYALYSMLAFPKEPIGGPLSAFILNGCSASSTFIVLVIWGVHYSSIMKQHLAFPLLMIQEPVHLHVQLGYSYWLLIGSICCHGLSEILLLKKAYTKNPQTTNQPEFFTR